MANALESASLVMIPSGYEDGTLGSLKPTDGTGDFTFTRGSNLSATRVAPNGYIEKGYENLLTYSNDFSNAAWTKTRVDLTSGQAGYDGSSDAWLFEANDTGGSRIDQTISISGVHTISFYAKQGTGNIVVIRTIGSNYGREFDLSNGTTGGRVGTSPIKSTIESVGDGWYRCSIVASGSTTGVRFQLNPTQTGDNIYIQDAMLNQGLVAYPYIETTTAPVAGGILEDEPRIDFSDGCGHLLLEPSRTNLVQFSEYAGSSYWSKLNSSVTNNAIISPEGLNNAFELTDNTTNGYHWIYQGNLGSFATHRVSFFAKANTLSQVWSNGGGGSNNAGFDLSNGTIIQENGTSNPTIEDYGNGWYRCSYTADLKGLLIATMKDNDNTYAGTGESIYLYGIQSEQDATYPTSYIPTYGVSQTRLADDMDLNLSTAWDSTGSWTICFEFQRMNDDSVDVYNIIRFDGTQGDLLFRDRSTTLQVLIIGGTQGISVATTGTINKGDTYKIAVKWDGTNIKSFFNGGEIIFSNPASGAYGFYNIDFNTTHIKHQEVYFPTALSDDECIELTTI